MAPSIRGPYATTARRRGPKTFRRSPTRESAAVFQVGSHDVILRSPVCYRVHVNSSPSCGVAIGLVQDARTGDRTIKLMRLRELNIGCVGGGTGLPSLIGGLKATRGCA